MLFCKVMQVLSFLPCSSQCRYIIFTLVRFMFYCLCATLCSPTSWLILNVYFGGGMGNITVVLGQSFTKNSIQRSVLAPHPCDPNPVLPFFQPVSHLHPVRNCISQGFHAMCQEPSQDTKLSFQFWRLQVQKSGPSSLWIFLLLPSFWWFAAVSEGPQLIEASPFINAFIFTWCFPFVSLFTWSLSYKDTTHTGLGAHPAPAGPHLNYLYQQ